MARYVVRRLFLGLITLWLVTVVVFLLLRVIVPLVYADVAQIIVAQFGRQDPVLVHQLRQQYGLDGNQLVQYLKWLWQILHGDLGKSLYTGLPVMTEIRNRLPVSIELGLIGLLSAVCVSVPLGIVAALRQDRWPDYTLRTLAIALNALPGFWLAILIITFGSIWFHWAPPLPRPFPYIWQKPITHLEAILLPALLVGLTPSAGLLRLMRTQMLEVMRQDYIRTARSKGLTSRRVIMRHAMRNSLLPIVTVIGLSLPALAAGTALYESIFTLPGMGQYLVTSVGKLDYPVIESTNLIFAFLIIFANLAVDICYPLLDPRIRYD
jgi:peptide/nickel transport system permease protein